MIIPIWITVLWLFPQGFELTWSTRLNHVWTKHLKKYNGGNLTKKNKQSIVYECKHMVSLNDRWMIWLKAILKGILFYWELKKLKQYNVIILYFHPPWFSRQEWLWLLQYSISKHGGWLNAFYEWNWAKTKYTRFISKHLWQAH